MLLLHAAENRHSIYSRYLAEILRLEGFVDFVELDLAQLDAATLARHDLVVLPRLALTEAQATVLRRYVSDGGKLLALMPDPYFARRFGLTPTWRACDEGWLHFTQDDALAGLCVEPVQIVTPTDGWAVDGASDVAVIAHVRPGKETASGDAQPAIVHAKIGQGVAILLAYDLAHAVARLRQGNPAHADLSYAGLDGIVRPSELFVGQMAVEQMLTPQADIHTALLARCVELLAPRPRLWYYPKISQRSVLLMTSDDDWSTVEQFEAVLAGLRMRKATCTFYIVPETKIGDDLMHTWEADGHTFSVHPALDADIHRYLAKAQPQSTLVEPMLRANVARHRKAYGRSVDTIRQHAVRWSGYVDTARVLADLGVRMELNFVSVYPFSVGYMAGSGRPLPFVDADGKLIDCYQQATMWTEEVLIHPDFVFSFKWTVERALQEVDQMIQRATRQFYTPIAINSHPVSFATYSSPLIEGTWDRALEAGMAIWSADRWLAWTEARNSVRFEQTNGGYLVLATQAMPELTILLPPGSAPAAAATQYSLWGRLYDVVTVSELQPGERRRLALSPP
jgi:hypothetical protein